MKPKILVLGFSSAQINDIQERLLRETVLREFREKGFPIVPVMELESIFYDEKKKYPGLISTKDLKEYCRDLKADFSLAGSLYPSKGSKSSPGIQAGRTYTCAFLLYSRKSNSFSEIKFESRGKKNLYKYFSNLSKIIVSKTEEDIRRSGG
ncbi:MAG: hypothetical protein GY754_33140 [bacterium]|nr:hypothetical protein [bacterium]